MEKNLKNVKKMEKMILFLFLVFLFKIDPIVSKPTLENLLGPSGGVQTTQRPPPDPTMESQNFKKNKNFEGSAIL